MAYDTLKNAKEAKNDEFYTQFADIQREINAYIEFNPDTFKNKTVLLPCDDPEWSNFTKFFAQNFEMLGLKKLISTSYAIESKAYVKAGYQYSVADYLTNYEKDSPQFDADKSPKKGKIFTLTRRNKKKIDIDDLEWKYLEGDGDFRSDEVTKLRDDADIIVTNPPFSVWRNFVEWIYNGNKQFIIIGSIGAVGYKEIFPLIKNNKLWLGYGFNAGNAYFSVPKGADTSQYAKGVYNPETNTVKFRNCAWFTNIDHGRRHQPLQLMSMEDNLKFSKHSDIKESGYKKYDNFDAIDVPYVDAIPDDYTGIMGVPTSFLDKYNPEQFEIIGTGTGDLAKEIGIKKNYRGRTDLAITENGKSRCPFQRILIKKKG